MIKKIDKHFEEFCLFNTWVIMRCVVAFAPNHPWYYNRPTLDGWFKNSTPLNIRMSRIITFGLIISWELIIFIIVKIIKGGI